MVEELLCLDMKSNKMDARLADQWHPPEDGCVKVNSDGSFDVARGQGAGAAVLRDHRGQILAAQAKWFGSVQEVLVTEALAARDGLKLASDLGLPRIVLESDSSVLVNAIKSSTMLDRSIIAGIWHDIRELSRSFISFDVHFVRREANSLADRCVREVSASVPELIWYDCIPYWLQDAAANDCNLQRSG
jgi:ribonuclease HI